MTTTHRITTTAVLVVSLAAAAAPGAMARPADSGAASVANPAPAVYSRQDKSLVASDKSPTTSAPANVASVGLPHRSSDLGWIDAGIGAAAGGIALSAVGLGVSQRRARRTRHTTALTS